MEKDQAGSTKALENKRIRNTPDSTRKNIFDASSLTIRPIMSRHRMTMTPGEIMQTNHNTTAKCFPSSRQSILPSHILKEQSKKTDVDTKDTELKLMYDEYLRSLMSDIIIREKSKDCFNKNIINLAEVSKNCEQVQEKLYKLKMRERDIKNLTIQQNEIDAEIIQVDKHYNDNTNDSIKLVLLQLEGILEPLDVLRCNNISLPESPEKQEKTRKVLQEATVALRQIMEIISSVGSMYQMLYNNLEDFLKTIDDIEVSRKKFGNVLCELQILLLKNASYSLSHSEI